MGYPEWLSFGFIGFGAASVISGTYVSLAGVVKFYRVSYVLTTTILKVVPILPKNVKNYENAANTFNIS
ncbi:hypothetical protein Pmar_PMAR028377 [Perkinsus marinus ATCC 50983]|uniref:Uncharacterized protein n=1 Tax=Perkinsus marinus (strain ATCC 50983 / TXsc) TaxID=423536 RepID=C5KBN3_PERM5|nr:hypothetical protein Pmar_PMAR028377 [Perkinsus marinus ATCC 50983]EER18103.1 hypothetical protein Pmar_PMAR028377 [Perkinsus marinus ATCC 50983]|eukprot:XP_002786307.1 hypothetical protein Pmar_PMAR028377 [Perkinsus marinus ATCC 50983]